MSKYDTQNARDSRAKFNKAYYEKGVDPDRVLRRWADDEIEQLKRTDITDSELSDRLDRSLRAIQIKRCRLRKCRLMPNKASKKRIG